MSADLMSKKAPTSRHPTLIQGALQHIVTKNITLQMPALPSIHPRVWN
jgi:hypothetical protein